MLAPATFLRRLSFGISVEKLKCLGVCSTFSWRWLIASALLVWEDKIPDPLSQDRQTLICTATSQKPQGIASRTPQWTPDSEDAQVPVVQLDPLYPQGRV